MRRGNNVGLFGCLFCSVGIPHKEAAVECCDEVHPLAKVVSSIGFVCICDLNGSCWLMRFIECF